jgi:hypothetical protein
VGQGGSPREIINKFASVKIWAYDAFSLKHIDGSPFNSKNKAASALEISHTLLNLNLDKNRACGKGVYLYTRPLKDKEIKKLLEKSDRLTIGSSKKVWAYVANSLELINNAPFARISDAAAYFNVTGKCIAGHTDTEKATKRKGILVYFFSRELNLELRAKLKGELNIALSRRFNKKIWAYSGDTLALINNTPFFSVKKASSFLKTNAETIKLHLDTGKAIKLIKSSIYVYFFSSEQDATFLAILLNSKPRVERRITGNALWVYDANTLELINNAPFPSRGSAGTYLNTHINTIKNNLDTKRAFKSKKKINTSPAPGGLFYFFSYEIDSKLKQELLKKSH